MKTRVVNIRSGKPYDVYIGRPSKWGNPYHIGMFRGFTREDAVACYRGWIKNQLVLDKRLDLKELQGKVLGCYCKPKACHGDILAEFADA